MIEVKSCIRSNEEKKYDTELQRRLDEAIKEIKAQQIKAKDVYGKIGQIHYGVCLEILKDKLGGLYGDI